MSAQSGTALPDALAILAGFSNPTALVGASGRIVHANERFWTQFTRPGSTPSRLQELVDDPESVVQTLLARWAASGTPLPGTLHFRHAATDEAQRIDGARVSGTDLLILNFQPLRSAVRPFSAVAADVERSNLEVIQRQLQDALVELDEANRLLQLANRELSEYASMVSHDLRSPLLTITALAADLVASRDLGEADAETSLSAIVRNARRGLKLVEAILALARLEVPGPTEEAHDLAAACDAAIEQLASAIDEADAAVDVPSTLLSARIEPAHLEVLFLNLIGNAIRFRSPDRDARVGVRAHRENGTTVLEIEDNGIGIAAERVESVFAPLERGRPAVGDAGSGIGLATCRKVVQRYGGSIEIDSVEGRGTTVTLRLPA